MLELLTKLTPLDALRFRNRFTITLPADPSTLIRPRQGTGACFSRVTSQQVKDPHLVAYAPEVIVSATSVSNSASAAG